MEGIQSMEPQQQVTAVAIPEEEPALPAPSVTQEAQFQEPQLHQTVQAQGEGQASLTVDDQNKSQNPIDQGGYSPPASSSGNSSSAEDKLNDDETEKTRYKYCCKVCKHTDRGKRACVCVVPLSQRRTLLGEQGCQTCRCHGCSIQDFVSRGEDPIFKIIKVNTKKEEEMLDGKGGCCKQCSKASSKNGKACTCQMPQNGKKGNISSEGCKICNCKGCTPEDSKPLPQQQKRKKSKSRSRERRRKQQLQHQHQQQQQQQQHHQHRSPSVQSQTPEVIDVSEMNFNNFSRSVLGNMLTNEFRLLPTLLGFGVPERTRSYILHRK